MEVRKGSATPLRIAFCVALILTATHSPARDGETIDAIVAVVNNQPITQSELADELAIASFIDPVLSQSPVFKLLEEPSAEVRGAILWELVERKLMYQETERWGSPLLRWQEEVAAEIQRIQSQYASEDEFTKALKAKGLEYAVLEEWVKSALIIGDWTSRRFFSRIDDEDIEAKAAQYYEGHKSEFVEPVRVEFGYIKVLSNPDDPPKQQAGAKQFANEIYARFQKGEALNDLQRAYQNRPDIYIADNAQVSGATGLGRTLAKLKVGGFSQPILRPDGYLVAKLVNKEMRQQTYPEARDGIKQRLMNQQVSEQLAAWLKEQKEMADIRILVPELVGMEAGK